MYPIAKWKCPQNLIAQQSYSLGMRNMGVERLTPDTMKIAKAVYLYVLKDYTSNSMEAGGLRRLCLNMMLVATMKLSDCSP
jgi:hypothetical protein